MSTVMLLQQILRDIQAAKLKAVVIVLKLDKREEMFQRKQY